MKEKKIIQALGFKPKENTSGIFYKKYNGYAIEIDFEKRQFNFGSKINFGDSTKTIQNIVKPEDWVVLECVDRLLEKGYKPENITLEKTWKTGHGTSGRLDILVTRDDGSAYLMIECKTWGKEFEKEFKRTEQDGGQLMTYFQQDKSADVLMLYASQLDKNNVQFRNEIIKIEDHYRQAGNVEDVFDRWNKVTNTNGIFDDWVKPYLFENKKLTNDDLKDLNEEDSKKIFHEFLSILRKHSVSDKPNAFNKIFNLFLAKIFDEKKRGDKELDFQWKEHKDNAVDFQIRLLNLYKGGMKDFLEKEIRGISDDLFKYETDIELHEKKKHVLLLDKNFDIKEVFDEETFEDNHRVLKEVVQLLQKYRIRYPRKQQHLSDFFERLLTTGLKQEAGQFFTPPPITRFIVRSLPISQYIKQQLNQPIPELPAVIDYSVGSGHFLTEVMEEYQRVIEQDIDTSTLETQEADDFVEIWRKKKYDWASKYIYGIEKDYRLVKVAKVGCYFYGDGLAQIILGDGLDNFKHSKSYRGLLRKNAEKPQFSFIVSNPPYSVSSFKGDLKNVFANKDFELFNSLSDRSSEIECLFIERTKQLLKTDGIAAIILPSSILSNSGIYTQAREIILKSFDIVAITELGSATFMATGTNTVTLFLKRREDTIAEQVDNSLTTFFTNHKDITINGIEKPIAKYLSHVWEDISLDDYKTLLQKSPNETIVNHEIYQEYNKKIKAKNEQDKWAEILEVEKEKLLYFILTYSQKVVLVKTGQKTKEKQFLGYEFSNRRGSEGMHPIQRSKTIDECTQLYDVATFENPEKASTYIYNAFNGKLDLEIPETLKENISYQNLTDMLTFDRADFEKNISLSVKKKVKIESKWKIVKIGQIATTQYGFTDKAINKGTTRYLRITDIKDNGSIDLNNEAKYINPTEETKKQFLLKDKDIVIARSGSVGKSAFYKSNSYEEMIFASYLIRLIIDTEKVLPEYLFNFTKTKSYWNQVEVNSMAVTQPNLNAEKIKEFKIPLPPKEMQQKIVDEIEVLEKQEEKAVAEIEDLKNEIYQILNSFSENAVSTFCTISKEKENPQNNPSYNYNFIGLEHIESNTGKITINKELGENILSTKNKFKEGDVLYGKLRPYLNKVAEPNFNGICSTDILVLNTSIPKLLKYALLSDKFVKQTSDLMSGVSLPRVKVKDFLSLKISLPTADEQQKTISEIEKIEKQITELEKQIAEIPKQKETILTKHL